MSQVAICIIIFLLIIVGFATNIVPMAVTAMIGMMLMVLTGCLDAETALKGFGNKNTILMASMFIVAAGLNRTQLVNNVSAYIGRISKGSVLKVTAGYVILTCLLAQVIPSALVVFSIVFPMAIAICHEMKYSPSKMMFSLGLTAIGTVVTSPAGGSINTFAQINGFLESFAYTEYNMSVMDIFYGRLPVLIFIVLYAIFIAPRFAPEQPVVAIKEVAAKKTEQKNQLKPYQEVVGYVTFLVVVIGLIFEKYIPFDSWQIAIVGALVIASFKVLDSNELVQAMNIRMLLLYVGSFGIGNALTATGTGDYIGGVLANIVGKTDNAYIIGFLFFIVPFLLSQVMLNSSVNSIFVPICIMTCKSLGCNPIGPILLVLTGCLTPSMGTPTVPMMMGVGGYDVKTLVKMNILPALGLSLIAVVWIITRYPLY